MADEQKHNSAFYKAVSFWFPILAVLISLAMSWGIWTTKLSALETSNNKQDAQIEAIGATFTEVKIKLAEIQIDLGYIRKQVDK